MNIDALYFFSLRPNIHSACVPLPDFFLLRRSPFFLSVESASWWCRFEDILGEQLVMVSLWLARFFLSMRCGITMDGSPIAGRRILGSMYDIQGEKGRRFLLVFFFFFGV